MKSKFVYIVLLFSLFLNISHDIVIAHETALSQSTLTLEDTVQNHHLTSAHALADLHEKFHFSGILPSFSSINITHFLLLKLFFSSSISPTSIQQNTFKPPIV